MKVAFCLYGLAGGINDKFGGLPVDFNIGFEHYKKHILDKNDYDVFIHTWSVNFEKEIKEIYKPKKSIFEKQIIFHKPNLIYKLLSAEPKRLNNIYSRWYSTKKAIELKQEYEKENNFKYDCVFVTRFDVAFFTDVLFEKYDMTKFYAAIGSKYYTSDGTRILNRDFRRVSKELENFKLVRKQFGYPHDKKMGIMDYWFFSNSDAMDKFSTLYDNIGKYLKEIRKEHSLFSKFNYRIYNNHVLAVRHLNELKMLDKLDFTLNMFDDFELVRRRFFGVGR